MSSPSNNYVPVPEDKFSFGIWTVGWQGVDVFGSAVRPPMPAERAVYQLASLGAYGVNFHDNDVFAFDASTAEREERIGAFRSALSHLVLPAVALGTIPLAVIARMTRSAMLEVLNEDYVRTARAKGLSPLRVVGLHALRNALIPVITVVGLQVGSLFGGAVLTETIFAWPGVGNWLIHGIQRRDYPVLQGGILMVATIVILVNLTVDILSSMVNPRMRQRG